MTGEPTTDHREGDQPAGDVDKPGVHDRRGGVGPLSPGLSTAGRRRRVPQSLNSIRVVITGTVDVRTTLSEVLPRIALNLPW